MSESVFDVAIVGYGPAGITAGIYTARRRLKAVLFGDIPGGEVVNSGEIENWPGDRTTEGTVLAEKMVQHVRDHVDMVSIVPKKITRVRKEGRVFHVDVEDNTKYQAKTVIYAAGRHPRLLNIPGEEEHRNKGVSYCATCDAPLFADKTVAVIGGGDSGAEAVIMLRRIAKKVYLLHIDEKLRAEPILVDNFQNSSNVSILMRAKTTRILGENFVNGLEYEDVATAEKKTLSVDGIFVTIGAIPNTQPVADLVQLSDSGAVVADRYGRTNVEGFFAAGDVTDIREAQIVVAAGQACSAALSVEEYLSRTKV